MDDGVECIHHKFTAEKLEGVMSTPEACVVIQKDLYMLEKMG